MDEFLIHAIVTVLMSPLLLVYGAPFIAAAALFHRCARGRIFDPLRLHLACGVAALGIAPAYDIYRAPLPIYTWLLGGENPGVGFMLASFAVTWLFVALQVRLLHRRRLKAPA